MAKKTKTSAKIKSTKPNPVVTFFKSRQTQTVIGSFLLLFSLFLLVSFISFFFNWQEDQSIISQFADKTVQGENLLGKVGANLSHYCIYNGFGLGAFIIPYLLFITGLFWLLKTKLSKLIISYNWGLLGMLWISVSLGFINKSVSLLSGVIGFEINEYLQLFIGKTGLGIILLFLFLA
jgi:S-DNA-T family DNA segregation ATPase FtsK/SpoIIIE